MRDEGWDYRVVRQTTKDGDEYVIPFLGFFD